jgi:hypothetical protein
MTNLKKIINYVEVGDIVCGHFSRTFEAGVTSLGLPLAHLN